MHMIDTIALSLSIKVMSKTKPTKELEILKYLNSEPLRSSPGNRIIPFLGEISSEDPDWTFFIMPTWFPLQLDPTLPIVYRISFPLLLFYYHNIYEKSSQSELCQRLSIRRSDSKWFLASLIYI